MSDPQVAEQDPYFVAQAAREASRARVVNIHHKSPHDVYIGRSRQGEPPNVWANPYPLESCQDHRGFCILRYLGHVQHLKLWTRTHELAGKRLGCFCAPKPCHGHALATLADSANAEVAKLRLQAMIRQGVADLLRPERISCALSGSRRLKHGVDATDSYEALAEHEADVSAVYYALDGAPWGIDLLHHGNCEGADQIADQWGKLNALGVIPCPAQWEKPDPKDASRTIIDPSAGPRRNAQMLQMVESFVAVWDGKTHKSGTLDFTKRAWDSKDWICWYEPYRTGKTKVIYYGIRVQTLARHISSPAVK